MSATPFLTESTAVPGARQLDASQATLMLSALTVLAVVADLPAMVRVPIVLAFCFLAPGLGLVGLLRLANPLVEVTLAVGVSIALLIVTSLVLVYLNAFSAGTQLAVLLIPAVAGSLTTRRRQAAEGTR